MKLSIFILLINSFKHISIYGDSSLIDYKYGIVDAPKNVVVSIETYLREYEKSCVEGDLEEYSYLSNDFVSKWSKFIKEYKLDLVKIGYLKKESLYFVVIEGRWVRNEYSKMEPFSDVIYLKYGKNGLYIDDKIELPGLEAYYEKEFQNKQNYGRFKVIEQTALNNNKLWFKKYSKPADISIEEWENSWEKHYINVMQNQKRIDEENKKINNIVYKTFGDLFQVFEVTRLSPVSYKIYDPFKQSFKSPSDSIRTYVSLNSILLDNGSYCNKWGWDEDVLKDYKLFSDLKIKPKFLSTFHVSFSGFLEYRIPFYFNFSFKDNKYVLVFVTFHTEHGEQYNLVKNKLSKDLVFTGVAFIPLVYINDEWRLVDKPNNIQAFDNVLFSLTTSQFNKVEGYKADTLYNKLKKNELPDEIISEIPSLKKFVDEITPNSGR